MKRHKHMHKRMDKILDFNSAVNFITYPSQFTELIHLSTK